MDYVLYVHLPAPMTPHVRFMTVLTQAELGPVIQSAVREWPTYERVEIYDQANRVIWKHSKDDFSSGEANVH